MGGSVDGAAPMQLELLTLRYAPALAAIDDAPLRELDRTHEIVSIREHFFVADDLPHLLCVVRCRPRNRNADNARIVPPLPAPAPLPESHDSPPALPAPEPAAHYDAAQRELYDAIRRWRAEQAERAGVPRYVVLTNRNIDALVRTRPDSLAGLQRVNGIGKAKLDQYGESLLELLRRTRAPRLVDESTQATEALRKRCPSSPPA